MNNTPDIARDQEKRNLHDEADFQEELADIFRSISSQVPVDKIHWIQTHYELRLMRIIAQASGAGGEKTNFAYNASREVFEILHSDALPETYIMNEPEIDPLGKDVVGRSKLFDWSALFINFRGHTDTFSSVVLYSEGKGRYTEDHIRPLRSFTGRLQQIADFLITENEKKIPDPTQKEPVKDKNEFFRQVTMRICGNLDLKTGVTQCLQYLSRFLPADALFVRQLEPEFQSERVLAESFGLFHQQSGTLIPLIRGGQNPFDRGRTPGVHIINRPEESAAMQPYSEIFGNDLSSIVMPLIYKKKPIGITVLGLEGRDRYQKEHMQLFELLHDPFVLAMSNEIKHREVIRLKNLIEAEKKDLQEELDHARGSTIIGASLGLKSVMENARLVAEQESPVLLSGETGAGKEVIANLIHRNSLRKDGPLIKVNCGGIPETLIDSELFGHEKGAFTGAVSRKMGRFERANRGTIFLDEVGELPLPAQVRLLRVLQNKVIERVGGTDNIPVDIRIIAATHRNLEEMVASGQFREDLWFRLNVFPIRIPPLRLRRSDIPALVDYFIERKSRELNIPKPSLSPGAVERLTAYEWPGNVRELENVIERELILGKGKKTLMFQNLIPEQLNKDALNNDMGNNDDVLSLEEINIRHIKKVLEITNGKVSGPGGAAEKLKINSNTLRKRMDKLGISYGWEKNKIN